jgi:hypothetical protein
VAVVDWLFRDRATGKLAIVQVPNVPLLVFLVGLVLRSVLHPTGTLHAVLTVVGTAALLVWAIDEIVRGVNPWRRALGGGVLIWQLLILVR